MSKEEVSIDSKSFHIISNNYLDWGNTSYYQWKYSSNYYDVCHITKNINLYHLLYHRGIIFKKSKELKCALIGDTVVNAQDRGKGYYNFIQSKTIELSKKKGASIIISWNAKNSVTNMNNKKYNFIEYAYPRYIKVLNSYSFLNNHYNRIKMNNKILAKIGFILKIDEKVIVYNNKCKLYIKIMSNNDIYCELINKYPNVFHILVLLISNIINKRIKVKVTTNATNI